MTPCRVTMALLLTLAVTTAFKNSTIRSTGRVVNGRQANQRAFPFIVSLAAYNAGEQRWSHKCGGSIVNRKIVLTACHCIARDNLILNDGRIYFHDVRSLWVVAGTGDWWRGSPKMQTSAVWRTIPHPRCFMNEKGVVMNDLALVELVNPLVFTKNVQPMKVFHGISAAMAELKRIIIHGGKCYTPGWGVTRETGRVSRVLMVAPTRLLSAHECRKAFCSISGLHCGADFDGMGGVCVFNPRANPCFGDSGGPLVCNGFVFGITSYGLRCLPGYPAVYTNVVAILEMLIRFGLW